MSPPKNAVAKKEGPGGGEQQGQVINLSLLEIPQLQQLKTQVEQELNFYQEAIVQLKDVQMKMNESQICLKRLSPEHKELLVPVTGSMFVRGELTDLDKILVDIGTGYYVEKTLEDAIDYFKRKVDFLGTQIDKVQHVGREKSGIRQAIMEVMETKIAQYQAAHAGKPPVAAVK